MPAQGNALGHTSQNTASPEGAKEGDSSSRLVPLDRVARHHSGNSKLIKGKLHDAPADNLFPAFSATGQDVWRDAFDREGDAIIISAVGARCGKCFLAKGRWSAIANTHVVWPDPDKANIEFLWYLLNDEQFWIRSGSAQPFVAVRKTFEKEIFVPPLPEQRRIVAEIEKQFTRLEAGVTALRRVQANLKRYRATVLKAACEGRLVPTEAELAKTENRTAPFETGEALLARILTDRRQNWQGRGHYKEPVATETAKFPKLPEGWTWATVEQLGRATTGFTPPKNDASLFGGDIPFFKPSDLDVGYYVREFRDSLTEAGAEHGRVLPSLSILVTCIGATIGKTGLARVCCTTNQQINALTVPAELVSAQFVYWCFSSPFGQRQIIDNASATTLPILNKSRFEALPIPLPPLAEQTRIVAEVERRLSVVEELESVVAANLQRATRLRQSILQRAFTGML